MAVSAIVDGVDAMCSEQWCITGVCFCPNKNFVAASSRRALKGTTRLNPATTTVEPSLSSPMFLHWRHEKLGESLRYEDCGDLCNQQDDAKYQELRASPKVQRDDSDDTDAQ